MKTCQDLGVRKTIQDLPESVREMANSTERGKIKECKREKNKGVKRGKDFPQIAIILGRKKSERAIGGVKTIDRLRGFKSMGRGEKSSL